MTGEADPSLEKVVDRIHWIALGQLRRLIKAFKQDGVRQAVMVGGVKKTHLFSDIRPDLRSLALLRRVSVRKDDSLLRAIASELEDEGIRIRESTFGLDGLLVEARPLLPLAIKPVGTNRAEVFLRRGLDCHQPAERFQAHFEGSSVAAVAAAGEQGLG